MKASGPRADAGRVVRRAECTGPVLGEGPEPACAPGVAARGLDQSLPSRRPSLQREAALLS